MVNSRVAVGANRVRQRQRRAARAFYLCSLVFLATVVFLLMFPTSIGAVWHLFNGNTATYKWWTVPVPKGFFAMQRKGILYIGRIERASVTSKGEYDLLVIVTVPSRNYFISERDSRKFQEIESAL